VVMVPIAAPVGLGVTSNIRSGSVRARERRSAKWTNPQRRCGRSPRRRPGASLSAARSVAVSARQILSRHSFAAFTNLR